MDKEIVSVVTPPPHKLYFPIKEKVSPIITDSKELSTPHYTTSTYSLLSIKNNNCIYKFSGYERT
jgi:hypothetical protein